jgi:hypothetical protein
MKTIAPGLKQPAGATGPKATGGPLSPDAPRLLFPV